MKIEAIKKSFSYLHEAKITPCVVGQRGTGKSETVKQYAKENGFNLLDLRLGQMADAGDIIGLADFLRNPEGQIIATKYMIPHYFQKTEKGKWVIFLDEINRAPKDILQAVFELVLDRSISSNGFTLNEESQIIAAMNPPTDDYSVNDFDDSAFYDRFCFIRFEPTIKEWIDYADNVGVERNIVSFIEKQTEMLEPKLADFNFDEFCKPSRRSWFAVDKLMKLKPDTNIFKELAFGLVGTTASIALFSHMENFNENIDENDVLNDYSKVKDLVQKFASVENNRTDILKNVCDRLLKVVEEATPMNKVQEEALVEFIIDLPKDMAYNFLFRELFYQMGDNQKPCFMNTETDPKNGLCNGTSKVSRKLLDYADKELKGKEIAEKFENNTDKEEK